MRDFAYYMKHSLTLRNILFAARPVLVDPVDLYRPPGPPIHIVALCAALCFADAVSAKAEDAFSRINALRSTLASLSYELKGNIVYDSGDKVDFLTKFWATGDKWRAERYNLKEGKLVPVYFQSFDGKRYNLLDFKTKQLTVTSKIMPKSPVYATSLYDNLPLQLFGFLGFDEAILPGEIKASPLNQILSQEHWNRFLDRAVPRSGEEGSDGTIYSVDNAAFYEPQNDTYTEVTFRDESDLFPAEIQKVLKDKSEPTIRIRAIQSEGESASGLGIPSSIRAEYFKWRKLGKVMTIDVDVSNVKVNPQLDDNQFLIDRNLASKIVDIDERTTLPSTHEQPGSE
jgi:outer membrane lipoprotein-sorting protein